MQRTDVTTMLVAVSMVVVCLSVQCVVADEFGVDVFGLSYHYESTTYVEGGKENDYNQLNPGLGLHWTFSESDRHIWTAKAGCFEDSKENWSLYAGPVYQYKLTESLHIGGGVLLFGSETYASPVIPMPLVTYRIKPVRLNATWMPAADDSESAAVAVFATITLWGN